MLWNICFCTLNWQVRWSNSRKCFQLDSIWKENQLCHCIVGVVVLMIDLFFLSFIAAILHIYHLCKVIQKQQQIFEKKVGHLMLTKTKPVYCDNLIVRNRAGLSGCKYILHIIICILRNHFRTWYIYNPYLTSFLFIIFVEYAPVQESTCIEFFVQLYNVPWEIELEDERSPAYFNMVHSVRRLVRIITL